jgi:hypothetical protein
MKRFKKPFNYFLSFLPYLTVFIFAMYSPSDPDLGWHLKYGEYFMQHGSVLRDNTFSTLMPNYHWANTSWMTDVLSYLVFNAGGFLGLTLLSSLVVTVTFFFFSRVAKLTLWDQSFLFPLLLYLVQPINAISFRGQQLSMLLIGILFYLISFYPKKPKTLFLLIPLFLLWANLHGEFIFGLALFGGWIGLYLLTELVQEYKDGTLRKRFFSILKTHCLFLLPLFLGSAFVTIINPFGIGIHTAALSHFGSPLLKNIAEYLPFELRSQQWWNQIIVGISIVIGFIFLFFKGKLSSRIPLLGLSLVIYALSFGVRRYAWPAYYMILPMLQPIAGFLKPDSKKVTYIMTAIFLFVLFGVAISSRFPFMKYATYDWNDYCMSNAVSCSTKSADFLVKNKLTSNVYSLYGWGGFLIWNHPEVKPVIDGRMHLWKDEKGFSGFSYYYAYEQNFEDINQSPYNVVYMMPNKPIYNRMLDLVNTGEWKLVYKDDYAGIFVRQK